MFQHVIKNHDVTYIRISKVLAKKMWVQGNKQFCLCPVKLRPGYPFASHFNAYLSEETDFDRLVMNFEWYNCNLHETGYYAAFYRIESDC